jgi:threonine dehydrogenase-like Zn-dependent dehydrogenase
VIYVADHVHKQRPDVSQQILDLALIAPAERRTVLLEHLRRLRPDVVAFSWRNMQSFGPHPEDDALGVVMNYDHSGNLWRRLVAVCDALRIIGRYVADRRTNFGYFRLVRRLLPDSRVVVGGGAVSIFAGWVIRHCPTDTVVVVGDGAVGLSGVLAAARMGAERVVAMSRHEERHKIARSLGATDVIAERGEAGEAAVLEITGGVGADAVLECVGTGQAMTTAITIARPGATVGYVGAPHGVELPVRDMFHRNVGVAGGVAPVRQYLPALRDEVLAGTINPGLVFDLDLPLDKVAEGYAAMDERRVIKTMLRP